MIRSPHDYYPTPRWCLRPLVEWLPEVLTWPRILDPCAGDGAIFGALRALGWDGWAIGWELRDVDFPPGVNEWAAGRDSLARARGQDPIVTNPPYGGGMADRFVQWGAAGGAPTVLLLRLGMLAGVTRNAWMRAHLSRVLVLPRRPSFLGHGSDNSDYAWVAWGCGREGQLSIADEEVCR